MTDLFSYPIKAGFKENSTSKEAADKIEKSGKAQNLRNTVLKAIEKSGPFGATADEIAETLEESVLNIRPRVSELYSRNLIKDNGNRRKNDTGSMTKVWVIRRRYG